MTSAAMPLFSTPQWEATIENLERQAEQLTASLAASFQNQGRNLDNLVRQAQQLPASLPASFQNRDPTIETLERQAEQLSADLAASFQNQNPTIDNLERQAEQLSASLASSFHNEDRGAGFWNADPPVLEPLSSVAELQAFRGRFESSPLQYSEPTTPAISQQQQPAVQLNDDTDMDLDEEGRGKDEENIAKAQAELFGNWSWETAYRDSRDEPPQPSPSPFSCSPSGYTPSRANSNSLSPILPQASPMRSGYSPSPISAPAWPSSMYLDHPQPPALHPGYSPSPTSAPAYQPALCPNLSPIPATRPIIPSPSTNMSGYPSSLHPHLPPLPAVRTGYFVFPSPSPLSSEPPITLPPLRNHLRSEPSSQRKRKFERDFSTEEQNTCRMNLVSPSPSSSPRRSRTLSEY